MLATLDGAITQLEAITFTTEVFSRTIEIPQSGYDQQAARQLAATWRAQIENDTLTAEQFDLLTRFTLLEQTMVDSRVAYTDIAMSISDVPVEIIKLPMGIRETIQRIPPDKACKLSPRICKDALKAVNDLMWGLIEQAKRPLIHALPENRQNEMKSFYDLIIATERRRLDGSLEWFRDQGLSNAITGAMVKFHYQSATQFVLDKGARTADRAAGTGDRWQVTGLPLDAERQLKNHLRDSQIARNAIQSDQKATKLRLEVLKQAEAVAALASLSPLALYAKTAELTLKIGRTIGESWIVTQLYVPSLNCVVYRGERLGEMAFDAARPHDRCTFGGSGAMPDAPAASAMLVAYHSAPRLSPLQRRFLAESEQYRQAVQRLNEAVQSRDVALIEPALAQLLTVSDAQQANLQTVGTLLLTHATLSPDDLALLQQQDSFTANALALYLATLETVATQQENLTPQTNLAQIAQTTLTTLDQMEQSITKVDLAPPTDRPLVLIRGIQTQVVGAQLQLEVTLANVGSTAVRDLRVDVAADGVPPVAPVLVGELPIGGEQRATVLLPLPQSAGVVVRAFSQDATLDTASAEVPQTTPDASTTPVLAPNPAPTAVSAGVATPAPTNQPFLIIGAIIVLVVLGLGAFWLVRQSVK